MADVKKLDAMLETLRDKPGTKRAPRNGVEMQVFVDKDGCYTITVNGRVVEQGMELSDGHAMQRAQQRADNLRRLCRKPVNITLI
jgi:hypothetical protein